MIYKEFGNTGKKVSALGFGCMRLPEITIDGQKRVDENKSKAILRRAVELGINYFDTGYFYGNGMSEEVLGDALLDIRKKIYISTKCHASYVNRSGDLRRILGEQLERLKTGYIDFYHLHGLRFSTYIETEKKYGWHKELQEARDQGLITHLSFSTHDTPENTKKIIDLGIFETMLCQFNLIDRSNEDVMAYAASKGLGVAVMGPLGGGRIPEMPGELSAKTRNNVETAFRFVFSNPNVDCVLSGMSDPVELEENVRIALKSQALSPSELSDINALMEQRKKLADLYCTGCSYCLPCPVGVDIPTIFSCVNYVNVYGMKQYAKKKYLEIGQGPDGKKKRADACIGCGKCEKKCPQNIEIRKQLIEANNMLKF